MIFPIGDDQIQGGHKPYVSYALIGINVLIFIFQVTMPIGQQQAFVVDYGAIPNELTQGQDMYTLLTSMFLHGGWMHLIGNMLFLWVFADNIEAIIGSVNFLAFYLLGGLAASVVHVLFNLGSPIPAVGASGAISAVLGAYLMMFPKSKVKVFVAYIFRSFYMPALYFLGFWGVQQFVNGFITIIPRESTTHTSGVAWWAHIGGFIFGIVLGYFAKQYYLSSAPQARNQV